MAEIIKTIKLSQIKVNAENPRTITDDKFQKLVNSILVFPKMMKIRPIVVDKEYIVLGGNMRTNALNFIAHTEVSEIEERLANLSDFKKQTDDNQSAILKYWKEWLAEPYVHIIRAEDLSPEEQKQFIIKDNLGYGEWNWDMLANDWDAVELCDWGLELWQTEEGTEEGEETDNLQEDNFNPNEEVNASCKPGDMWQLGNHRLLCGDSTREEDVKRLMQEEMADLWLTDPPYNIAVSNSQGMTIENDSLPDSQFLQFLTAAFNAAEMVMKNGCPFYVWFASSEHSNFWNALNRAKLQVREELIWVKNAFTLGRQDYQWRHEPCMYGWKEGAAHYFIDVRNESTVIPDAEEIDLEVMKKKDMKSLLELLYSQQLPSTIIEENKPTFNKDHPTMKPVRLFGRLIHNSSRRGDIVLDTFGGSGTTMVACEQMGRKARLMELDPHYCDVIIRRYEELTGDKAKKIE